MRYLSDRSATLAMGQLPLVILLSGTNSPIALISGLEMNDLMLYHRWLARMVWFQMNVHGFGYVLIALLKSHLLRNFGKAYWNWGVVVRLPRIHGATAYPAPGNGHDVGSDRLVDPRDPSQTLRGMSLSRNEWLALIRRQVFVFLHILLCIIALVGLYLHIHLLHHHKVSRNPKTILNH